MKTWAIDPDLNLLNPTKTNWDMQLSFAKAALNFLCSYEEEFEANFKQAQELFSTLFNTHQSAIDCLGMQDEKMFLLQLLAKQKGLLTIFCRFLSTKYQLLFYIKFSAQKSLEPKISKNVVYQDQVLKKHYPINRKYKKDRQTLKILFQKVFYEAQKYEALKHEHACKVEAAKVYVEKIFQNILSSIQKKTLSSFQLELMGALQTSKSYALKFAQEIELASSCCETSYLLTAEFLLNDLKNVFKDYHDQSHMIVRAGAYFIIPLAISFLTYYLYEYWMSTRKRKPE